MATVQRFEGRSLDDVLAQVRQALGDDAEIIEANRIKASGGFGSDRYEVKARRAKKGQRKADRRAADAHINPRGTSQGGAKQGRASQGEPYPGGLDDATVQAAMDHVQQVMADLERKRVVEESAHVPGPTSLVDLADQVQDGEPDGASGFVPGQDFAHDPGFAKLLADARKSVREKTPAPQVDWPELEPYLASDDPVASAQADRDDAQGDIPWEPLDWSARRVRQVDPEASLAPDEDVHGADAMAETTDLFTPGLMGDVDEANDIDEAIIDAALVDDLDGHDATADDAIFDNALLDDALLDDEEAEGEGVETSHVEDTEDDIPGVEDAEVIDPHASGAQDQNPSTMTPDEDPRDLVAEDSPTHVDDHVGDAVLSDMLFANIGDEPVEQSAHIPDSDEPGESPTNPPASLKTPEGAVRRIQEAPAGDSEPEVMDGPAPVRDDADDYESVANLSQQDEEVDPSAQSGWVDADSSFMGVWTDEAESNEAGWFENEPVVDDVHEYATMRNHRLVEWLSRNDLTQEALDQALKGLPRPDDLPPGPGLIIAVVGEGPLVLPLARRMAAELHSDAAKVVLASEHRSHASVPDNCRISTADEAALDRRSWRRRADATVVAVDTSSSLALHAQDWACMVLEALQPHQVVALVDAGRKAEDVARWIADLGGVDSIALTGLEETVSPHAILELGIPVARLGTKVASSAAWTDLLRNRREAVQ